MRKIINWFLQFRWYILFAGSITGFKVYADYNNINIWPSSNETEIVKAGKSQERSYYFFRGNRRYHK